MNITIFISSLYGGGAERVACNLANFLEKKGHTIEILTMSETHEKYDLNENISVRTLVSINERNSIIKKTIFRICRFIKYLIAREKDVYIVMLPRTTIMLLAFRWLTKAKVIASERVDPATYADPIAKNLKKLARRADAWVFQTEDAKKWYGETIRNCKSIVIPNAVNPAFIRKSYIGEKRKIIATAGRLDSQKNFHLLIEAFSKISKEFQDFNLVIYGKGIEESALKEYASDLGLQKRVVFPGNIQNIAEEMEKNSMFVLSSDFEGMPNALMEAMALGMPCVATDCPCGGPRFLIENEVNGLLVPVGDAEAIAKAMKNILSDHNMAEKLGSEARKISSKLAPDKIYGQWEEFIVSIIERR